MKDLLKGDSAISLLKLTEAQLKETENKVSLKDSIIVTMQEKERNYVKIVDAEREKLRIQEEYSKSLEKSLRREKVKNKFTKIVSGGVVAALGFLLISR